mmetsp:Transcript_17664/g.67182  ORF Transcript_17664/g.67182 Transcript_17664/m.67182 type:complete len:172 (-) Transcript_17664:460-975(-)
MDSDVAILNQDIRLEGLLGQHQDITVTSDLGGINAGSIVVRNTTWTRWYLDELWRQEWLEHVHHVPFKWDQRAFHYTLQTSKWRESPVGSMIPYPVRIEDEGKVCDLVLRVCWQSNPTFLDRASEQSSRIKMTPGFMFVFLLPPPEYGASSVPYGEEGPEKRTGSAVDELG